MMSVSQERTDGEEVPQAQAAEDPGPALLMEQDRLIALGQLAGIYPSVHAQLADMLLAPQPVQRHDSPWWTADDIRMAQERQQ